MEELKRRGKAKGSPKSGGRKKGTPNKKTLFLADALTNLNFNLAEEIIASLSQISDPSQKMQYLLALLDYTHPRLKELEAVPDAPASTQDSVQQLSDEQLDNIVSFTPSNA